MRREGKGGMNMDKEKLLELLNDIRNDLIANTTRGTIGKVDKAIQLLKIQKREVDDSGFRDFRPGDMKG